MISQLRMPASPLCALLLCTVLSLGATALCTATASGFSLYTRVQNYNGGTSHARSDFVGVGGACPNDLH